MSEWAGEERREYCKLCKQGTNERINELGNKISNSNRLAMGLLVVCFILSGIAWSAKSDVEHQKEIISDIRTTQLKIKDDLTTVVGFLKLFQEGKISK